MPIGIETEETESREEEAEESGPDEPQRGRIDTAEGKEQGQEAHGAQEAAEPPPRWLSLLVELYWVFRVVGTAMFILAALYGWLVGCLGCSSGGSGSNGVDGSGSVGVQVERQ